MPGSVTISEAQGAPVIPASADFAVCVVGCSTTSPLASGLMSAAYSSAASAASDYGLGDGIDCLTQAITPTQGNPAPPPVCFYRTPATTTGSRGATLTTSIASSRVAVTKTAATHPVGTYEPKARVKTGGTLGTAGIVIEFSPDNGRKWLPSVALGTATTLKMQISGIDTGVQYDFASVPYTGTTDITDSALYGVGGDLDGLTVIVNGTTVTLNIAGNAASKAALLAALSSALSPVTATEVGTHLVFTSAATATLTIGAGTANTLLGLTAGTYAPTFTAGDTWSETITTPPQWAVADLYTAGSPATGAIAAIAQSATAIAIVVLSEPVAASDFSTLSTALDYAATRGKKLSMLARFRPRASDETDATYTAAFATFCAAATDNRITTVSGEGWLTDAYRGHRYFRSGLPAVLARMQSMAVIPGKLGERMAQHPGYVGRGPLENFSIVDDAGNPLSLAHDEALTGGIDGPLGGRGGGLTFYYQHLDELKGTYVSEAPVRYAALSAILTWMDRRVANGIERIAESEAWLSIQGADIFDPVTFALDPDIVNALQGSIAKRIKDRYGSEFQNPDDPNLVSISPTVTVDGASVAITGTINVRFFGYTRTIALSFAGSR